MITTIIIIIINFKRLIKRRNESGYDISIEFGQSERRLKNKGSRKARLRL